MFHATTCHRRWLLIFLCVDVIDPVRTSLQNVNTITLHACWQSYMLVSTICPKSTAVDRRSVWRRAPCTWIIDVTFVLHSKFDACTVIAVYELHLVARHVGTMTWHGMTACLLRTSVHWERVTEMCSQWGLRVPLPCLHRQPKMHAFKRCFP